MPELQLLSYIFQIIVFITVMLKLDRIHNDIKRKK